VSDSSQGAGWWQASDGKWYPPDQAPPQAPAAFGAPNVLPATGPGLAPLPPGEGGFFNRLFDMSFTRFITPSIIKLLFVLSIVMISIFSLFMLIAGLATLGSGGDGAAGGIVFVIFAPIYWLLGVIWSRVILELVIVFFRIETNTRT